MSQAIVLTQAQGNVHAAIRRIDDAELPPADTTLRERGKRIIPVRA